MKSLAFSLTATYFAANAAAASLDQHACRTVTAMDDIDVSKFSRDRWYIHERKETPFQPKSLNYCVSLEFPALLHGNESPVEEYGLANAYSMKVLSQYGDEHGNLYTSDDHYPTPLCLGSNIFDGDKSSEMTLGFCMVPAAEFQRSNFWVLAYEEGEGYALVSGGQVDVPSISDDGQLCTYSNPAASLLILSRSSQRDEGLIKKYRQHAADNGIDPSVLKQVYHDGCDYTPDNIRSKMKNRSKKTKSQKSSPKRERKYNIFKAKK